MGGAGVGCVSCGVVSRVALSMCTIPAWVIWRCSRSAPRAAQRHPFMARRTAHTVHANVVAGRVIVRDPGGFWGNCLAQAHSSLRRASLAGEHTALCVVHACAALNSVPRQTGRAARLRPHCPDASTAITHVLPEPTTASVRRNCGVGRFDGAASCSSNGVTRVTSHTPGAARRGAAALFCGCGPASNIS